MGTLIARKFVVLVENAVASKPYATLEDAVDCATSFSNEVSVEIACFWSGRKVWRRGAYLARIATRR